MRVANLSGRAVLISPDGRQALDIAELSDFRFGPGLPQLFEQWGDFCSWVGERDFADAIPVKTAELQAPSPAPSQIFAVGLNYRSHATEVGVDLPERPMVFTKFASCLSGPISEVTVPESEELDWEVELVVVMGHHATEVTPEQAWSYVAGVTAGQDISDRWTQRNGGNPSQWSLGKSRTGYGPTGPWLVTPDSLPDQNNLQITCSVNGEVMQDARTDDLIFSVADLVSYLSSICTLRPGDLIFTGTCSGVAAGRPDTPWLKAGDELVTTVEGVGELRQRIIAS